MKFFRWLRKMGAGFIAWLKLLFADDDEHHVSGAPTMKNVVFALLAIIFCISFLKVVYLMEVVVRHDVRTSNIQTVIPDNTKGVQTTDTPTYFIQVPEIPNNWMTVFLGYAGLMAALSGAKKVAALKYGGNNDGTVSNPAAPPKEEGK